MKCWSRSCHDDVDFGYLRLYTCGWEVDYIFVLRQGYRRTRIIDEYHIFLTTKQQDTEHNQSLKTDTPEQELSSTPRWIANSNICNFINSWIITFFLLALNLRLLTIISTISLSICNNKKKLYDSDTRVQQGVSGSRTNFLWLHRLKISI